MAPTLRWRAQLLWVAIGLCLGPGSVYLYNVIKEASAADFVWHSRPSLTTEYWQPRTRTFAPGPTLTTAREDAHAVVLDDGSLLLVEGGISTAERLDPATGAFVPTGPLPVALPTVARLLPAPGGAVVIGIGVVDFRLLRYEEAANRWSDQTLTGDLEAICAQRLDASRILLVASSLASNPTRWETHARVMNLATGAASRVPLPFMTLDCILSAPVGGSLLLVANVDHAEDEPVLGVRAFTLAEAEGRLVVTPVPKPTPQLFVPMYLRRRDDGAYRLVRDDRAALLDPRTGAVTHDVSLSPARADYPSWVPSGSDAAVFVGGQQASGDAPRPSWDVLVAEDVSVVDLGTGVREPLPPLRTPKMRAFMSELPDGRILVGGGRERQLVVLWAAIAKCIGAWLALPAIVVGLALLARHVRPRRVTLFVTVVLTVLLMGILFLIMVSGVRMYD